MMKKRTICALLAGLLLVGLLTGCGGKNADEPKRLSVVTTIFPEYDWVMHILGDRAAETDVTMLLDTGVDLHSYQPTADDMIRISTCDLFIYVGGASDSWVNDALKTAVNKDMIVIDLMDVLGDAVREEEVVEGMQADEDEDEGDGPEYDEHVWLSLRCAATLCQAICDAMVKLDGEHKDEYEENTNTYLNDLYDLDVRYESAVMEGARDTVLFGDRFPFRYLTDDYGLEYYAAFVGCSAETEASFETVAFLADKVNELRLPAILTLEGTDHRLAATILSASGAEGVRVLEMNSMQSVTKKDVEAGASYLNYMEKNLAVLKQALKK